MNDFGWQHNIVDNYIKWIRDNTSIKFVEGACKIITPFLDRHNDHLEIYIQKKDHTFLLTDDGYTLADLKMSGMDMGTPKRNKILAVTLNGFGVKLGACDELYIEANQDNLAQKKFYFLQAMLAVNDMFVLSQENVASFFLEDVETYFKNKNIIYTKDIKLPGKSGLDHNIDFLVPALKNKPEQLVKIVNVLKKDSVKIIMFTFNDIAAGMRGEGVKNYVIYNDEKKASSEVLSALKSYNIPAIPWSMRERCEAEFTMAA